jgi:hypothetical protein
MIYVALKIEKETEQGRRKVLRNELMGGKMRQIFNTKRYG